MFILEQLKSTKLYCQLNLNATTRTEANNSGNLNLEPSIIGI